MIPPRFGHLYTVNPLAEKRWKAPFPKEFGTPKITLAEAAALVRRDIVNHYGQGKTHAWYRDEALMPRTEPIFVGTDPDDPVVRIATGRAVWAIPKVEAAIRARLKEILSRRGFSSDCLEVQDSQAAGKFEQRLQGSTPVVAIWHNDGDAGRYQPNPFHLYTPDGGRYLGQSHIP